VVKQLYYNHVEGENAGRLVIPEVAVELLATEQSLADHAVGCLVAADRIADVGKGYERNKNQHGQKLAAIQSGWV